MPSLAGQQMSHTEVEAEAATVVAATPAPASATTTAAAAAPRTSVQEPPATAAGLAPCPSFSTNGASVLSLLPGFSLSTPRAPAAPDTTVQLPTKVGATGGNAPTPRCPLPPVTPALAPACRISSALQECAEWANMQGQSSPVSGAAPSALQDAMQVDENRSDGNGVCGAVDQDISGVAPAAITTAAVTGPVGGLKTPAEAVSSMAPGGSSTTEAPAPVPAAESVATIPPPCHSTLSASENRAKVRHGIDAKTAGESSTRTKTKSSSSLRRKAPTSTIDLSSAGATHVPPVVAAAATCGVATPAGGVAKAGGGGGVTASANPINNSLIGSRNRFGASQG